MPKVYSLIFFLLMCCADSPAAIVVTGTITGTDGRSLPLAVVSVRKPELNETLKTVVADKEGKYEISFESKGIWLLQFSGAYSPVYTVAVYADTNKTIHLNVRLANYRYEEKMRDVKLLGNFNLWYPPDAVHMNRDSDGTYFAEIIAKAGPVVYQLSGVAAGNIPGTEADSFTYDRYHGYNSVINASGPKVRIVFDPSKLSRFDKPSSFEFSSSDSIESRFARVYDEIQRWNAEYMDYYLKTARLRRLDQEVVGFDFKKVLSALGDRLEKESEDVVRQELLLSRFMFLLKAKEADSLNSARLLAAIPPSSSVWSLGPAVISIAWAYSQYPDSLQASYVQRFMAENPSREAVAFLLSNEFMKKLYGGQKEEALKYYDIAVNHYGDTPGGKEVAKYHNVSAIDVGKAAPPFTVRSARNPKIILSNKSFRGRFLLIDFWATWDRGSVEEFGNLRKAYEAFGRKGLSILTLSLDSTMRAQTKFERENGKFPWSTARLKKGFEDKICRDYEVYSLPKPILVDRDGKIVAVGPDLRGDNLLKTLSGLFQKKERK